MYFEINSGMMNPYFITTSQLNSVQFYTKTANDDAFYGELRNGLEITPQLQPHTISDLSFTKSGLTLVG